MSNLEGIRTSIGKIAYVGSVPGSMLDAIERSELSITASGDGIIYTTHEAVEEYLSMYAEYTSRMNDTQNKTYNFLEEVFNELTGEKCVDEIAFTD